MAFAEDAKGDMAVMLRKDSTTGGIRPGRRAADAGPPIVGPAHLEEADLPITDRPDAYRESRITLAAVPSAVSCSRWFVRFLLQHWGLAAQADTAELLASELTTNAVKATGVIDSTAHFTELRGINLIRIQVTSHYGSVFVSVWDSDPNPPVFQPHDLEDESGHGLPLVAAMSRRWSYYPSPKGGKVVWCETAPPPPRTAAGLQRRQRAPHPLWPAQVMRERTTLLRVRDALLAL